MAKYVDLLQGNKTGSDVHAGTPEDPYMKSEFLTAVNDRTETTFYIRGIFPITESDTWFNPADKSGFNFLPWDIKNYGPFGLVFYTGTATGINIFGTWKNCSLELPASATPTISAALVFDTVNFYMPSGTLSVADVEVTIKGGNFIVPKIVGNQAGATPFTMVDCLVDVPDWGYEP